jgi:exopolyphosphatase/guanosine-5'-triphosphate,3'-diphosphate pyrophosphatase
MLTLANRPSRDAHAAQPFGSSPKEAAVARWVARRLGTVAHERQVAAVASSLFDITQPLHGLGAADRRLLRLGAFVHDVGRSVKKADHPAIGADMVLGAAGGTLALTATERRLLAYLTAHHKGDVPATGADPILSPADDAQRMIRLLALLRAADALDSRSLETPRLVFALGDSGTRKLPVALRVHCYLQSDTPKARKVYRRRKKFRLLEDVLNCRVEIEIARAHALRLVA